MDHSQCRVTMTPQWGEHVCPPCPHGLERGGTFALHGDPDLDAMQHEMKIHAIDQFFCGSAEHDALVTRAGVEVDDG